MTWRSYPARKLFSDSTNETVGERSSKIQDEAKQACGRSMENLLERFNFDVSTMKPMRPTGFGKENWPKTTWKLNSWNTNVSTSLPTSPSTNHTLEWHWEELDVNKTYVPRFYHSRYFHSDSNLLIPHTPEKRLRSDTTSVDRKPRTTPTARVHTLFRLWSARIRRSSHTDLAMVMKSPLGWDEPSEPRRTRSSIRRGDSMNLPTDPLVVPKNSPIKPKVRSKPVKSRAAWRSNWSLAYDPVKSPSEDLNSTLCATLSPEKNFPTDYLSKQHHYRQLTLLDCTRWRSTKQNPVTTRST